MKPIDKLNDLDYTQAFYDSDTKHFERGLFCIFSDNGHAWFTGTLTGIEETTEGALYRNEHSLQYKHCHAIKPDPVYLQHVIVKQEPCGSCYDGYIVGEYIDQWLVMSHRMMLVPKSMVAFIDDIKFGDEA